MFRLSKSILNLIILMKIKNTLIGILLANSMLTPIYADTNWFEDEEDKPLTEREEKDDPTKEKEEKGAPIKFSGSLSMSPSITYQDETSNIKNSATGNLKIEKEVTVTPKEHNAALVLGLKLTPKEVKFVEATATIHKFLTIGYGSSLFEYEKSNPNLFVSPSANVLQLKFQHTFNCLQFGYGLEKALELKLGEFKKQDTPEDKKISNLNKLDDPKSTTKPFTVHGDFPAFGMHVGVVNDTVNISLSGLGRFSNYSMNTKKDDSNTQNQDDRDYQLSWGTNLGAQYTIMPKKLVTIVEGFYTSGLGDYISGSEGIQSDEERKEMCSSYYYKDENDTFKLEPINIMGGGATVEFTATPSWIFTLSGSYLQTLDSTIDEKYKPHTAFKNMWHGGLKATYKLTQSLSVSAQYGLAQENRQSEDHSMGLETKISGDIKFSF